MIEIVWVAFIAVEKGLRKPCFFKKILEDKTKLIQPAGGDKNV